VVCFLMLPAMSSAYEVGARLASVGALPPKNRILWPEKPLLGVRRLCVSEMFYPTELIALKGLMAIMPFG
jgi:hypothetical protein